MPYTVYKVTNLVTQDFYIGVHKTDDPNDAYLGSGKVIREQVAHYGPENFQKVILNSFDKRKDAYRLEAELVNPLLGTPGCLNLHPGGHGGFGYLNKPGGHGDRGRATALAHKSYLSAMHTRMHREATDPVFAEKMRATRAKNLEEARKHVDVLEVLRLGTKAWTGHRHSLGARQRMSEAKKGANNGRFGKTTLHNPHTLERRTVPNDEVQELLNIGWVRGRHPRKVWTPPPPPACPSCGIPTRRELCASCSRLQVHRATLTTVQELLAQGKSAQEIMRALGKSQSNVYRLLRELNVTRP